MKPGEIIERLQKLTGTDRELDALIWCVEIPRMADILPHWLAGTRELLVPRFTASLDTTTALVEKMLPGWRICFEATNGIADDVYLLGPNYNDRTGEDSSPPVAGKPTAIAILIALFTALAAKGDE